MASPPNGGIDFTAKRKLLAELEDSVDTIASDENSPKRVRVVCSQQSRASSPVPKSDNEDPAVHKAPELQAGSTYLPCTPAWDILSCGQWYFIRLFTPYCDVVSLLSGVTWQLDEDVLAKPPVLVICATFSAVAKLPPEVTKEYGLSDKSGLKFVRRPRRPGVGPFRVVIPLPLDMDVSLPPSCMVSSSGPVFVVQKKSRQVQDVSSNGSVGSAS